MSMGVFKDYRNRGIDLAFYYYSYKNGVPKGYMVGKCPGSKRTTPP